jgi:hypothetical protein
MADRERDGLGVFGGGATEEDHMIMVEIRTGGIRLSLGPGFTQKSIQRYSKCDSLEQTLRNFPGISSFRRLIRVDCCRNAGQ